MSTRETSRGKKIALLLCVCAVFAAACLITAAAERFVAEHPLETEDLSAISQTPGEGQDAFAEENTVINNIGSTAGEPVQFSLDAGFYDAAQSLALSAEDSTEILYTRDGSDPADGGQTYRRPIKLKAQSDKINSYTITARAKYSDGTFSEPVTRSYILGKDISSRFDCLVFSLTIDPDMLYNYEDGIFIAGKMRDDYLATNPEREIQPTDPANWNQRGRAGERPCYVEVFEYDGTPVISQNCGMRIFGGWSRSNEQKNLKLYARTEYDETDNRFRYEFFPDASDSQGNKIVSYKKLALRACANDAGSLYARDDAISALAQATGVESKYSRPAAIFLNGEYYGFAWLQQVFSEDLLDHKYNVEDGSWDIIKGCEYMMIEDEDDPDWARKNDDWRKMYEYAYTDLTDDKNFDELSKLIDIDNMLTYYALNSYIGNGDWPNNNYKVYRYRSGSVEMSDEAPYDGRWRFMLYDTDFAFGLYGNDFLTIHMQQLFDEDSFGIYPEDWRDDVHDKGDLYYKRSDLLISLCKREDIRDRFVEKLCAMAGYYFNAQRVADYFDEYSTLRLHELVAASEEGKANVWSVGRELESCKTWASKRPYAIRTQMSRVFPEAFSKDEIFSVKCEPAEGAVINRGSAAIVFDDGISSAGFDGFYFKGMEIPLSAELEKGYVFESWEINGKTVTEPQTVITADLGENVEIKLNLKPEGGAVIYEAAYKATAGGDYIILKNTGAELISTSGMTVSDGTNEFILPTLNLEPGATVKLIGKNYSKMDAIGCIECGFNLKEGETVTLYGPDKEKMSEVELRLAHKKTALRYDGMTGGYREVSCGYNTRLLEAEIPEFNWGNWGGGGGWGGNWSGWG